MLIFSYSVSDVFRITAMGLDGVGPVSLGTNIFCRLHGKPWTVMFQAFVIICRFR